MALQGQQVQVEAVVWERKRKVKAASALPASLHISPLYVTYPHLFEGQPCLTPSQVMKVVSGTHFSWFLQEAPKQRWQDQGGCVSFTGRRRCQVGCKVQSTTEASEGLLGQRGPGRGSFPVSRQQGLNRSGRKHLSPFYKPVPSTGSAHRKIQVRHNE